MDIYKIRYLKTKIIALAQLGQVEKQNYNTSLQLTWARWKNAIYKNFKKNKPCIIQQLH